MSKPVRPRRGRPTNAERDAAIAAKSGAATVDGIAGAPDDGGGIDPATLGGNSAGDDTGSGNGGDDQSGNGGGGSRTRRARGPSRKSAPLDLTDLKDILVLAHAGISIAFRAPNIAIDDGEGEKLAAAVQKVLRHYDLPDVASETKDWIALMIVASSVYGPRVAAYYAGRNTPTPRTAQEQDDNLNQGGVVVPMHQ